VGSRRLTSINRRFQGTRRFHLQDLIMNQARNQHDVWDTCSIIFLDVIKCCLVQGTNRGLCYLASHSILPYS
jgi:hypothetical protein